MKDWTPSMRSASTVRSAAWRRPDQRGVRRGSQGRGGHVHRGGPRRAGGPHRAGPLVGRGGQLLDDMLAMIDLKREKVFIGNMVKCRPPQNRDPLNIEQEACIGYLRNQVALLKPKIIVCLGRIAAMKLIKEDFKITREHGQWIEKAGVWMMAMYHPSALLRDPRKRPESFEDLKSLQAKIREVCVRTY